MKKLSLLFCPVLLMLCCEDNVVPQPSLPPPPPPCLEVECETEDEFFGKAIMNGECWVADYTTFRYGKTIRLGMFEIDGIGEKLSIGLGDNTDLKDTIWLGSPAGHGHLNIGSAYYGYNEFHSSAGGFDFPYPHPLTYEDFLIIDYFNADTSILEGHFQVRFPNRSVVSFVNAPDTMRLGCGSFRVRAL
jgi:hypothetical protein